MLLRIKRKLMNIDCHHEEWCGVWTYLSHAPHDAVFLCVDKALQHDADGHVHIVLVDVLPEMHASVGLSHADDRLNVTNSNGDTSSCLKQNRNLEWILGQHTRLKAPKRTYVGSIYLGNILDPSKKQHDFDRLYFFYPGVFIHQVCYP